VNGAFRERSFVSESGKAVKPGSGQTGEHGSRASPEQCGSENLPVSKRAGMGDHHAAGRVFASARRISAISIGFPS
jgi:hypothetical protein